MLTQLPIFSFRYQKLDDTGALMGNYNLSLHALYLLQALGIAYVRILICWPLQLPVVISITDHLYKQFVCPSPNWNKTLGRLADVSAELRLSQPILAPFLVLWRKSRDRPPAERYIDPKAWSILNLRFSSSIGRSKLFHYVGIRKEVHNLDRRRARAR